MRQEQLIAKLQADATARQQITDEAIATAIRRYEAAEARVRELEARP